MPSYNVISHEKDISTFSTQATKQARFPQAHVFCQRTQRLELTPSERPQEIERKFGATPQRHRAISNATHSAERRPHRKGADQLLFLCPSIPNGAERYPDRGMTTSHLQLSQTVSTLAASNVPRNARRLSGFHPAPSHFQIRSEIQRRSKRFEHAFLDRPCGSQFGRRCAQRSSLRFAQEARGNPLQLVPLGLHIDADGAIAAGNRCPATVCRVVVGDAHVNFRPINGFRFAFGVVCNTQTWMADAVKGLINAPMLELPSGGQGGDISMGKSNLCGSPFCDDRLIARAESRRCQRCQTFENHCEIGHWRAFRGCKGNFVCTSFALEYNEV